MKKYFAILTLFFFNHFFTQIYRFEYELKILLDTTSVKHSIFNVAAEISPNQKKFFDLDEYKNDSIRGSNNRFSLGFDQRLLKNRESKSNESLYKINGSYFSILSNDKINWEIEKETKKILEYRVQKATCAFGGRLWTAWFTRDIPINEGPYKFDGLPGMILEISDSKNHYQYSLTKIVKLIKNSNTNNILETDYGSKAYRIDWSQFQKLNLDYYSDPFINLKNQGTFPVNINGTTYNKYEELISIRNNIQNKIKQNYNPLERNKLIKYPIK